MLSGTRQLYTCMFSCPGRILDSPRFKKLLVRDAFSWNSSRRRRCSVTLPGRFVLPRVLPPGRISKPSRALLLGPLGKYGFSQCRKPSRLRESAGPCGLRAERTYTGEQLSTALTCQSY